MTADPTTARASDPGASPAAAVPATRMPRRAPFAARLLGALLALGSAPLACAQAEDVHVDARAGLGPCALPGAWIPLVVEAGDAAEDVTGELRVVIRPVSGPLGLAQETVTVPRQARKRFDLEVLARGGSSYSAEIRDARGRVRGRAEAAPVAAAPARLWVVVGTGWMGLDELSKPGGTVDVLRLEPEAAPRRPLGWSAAERVVVGPVDPARPWPAEARRALRRWIESGGSAVLEWKTFAGGFLPGVEAPPPTAWLPAPISPEDWSRLFPLPAPPERPTTAFAGRIPGAEPVWPAPSPAGACWAHSVPLGLGEVLVLGFAFEQPSLREWDGRLPLWGRLCDQELAPPKPAEEPAPTEGPPAKKRKTVAPPESASRSTVLLPLLLEQLLLPETASRIPLALLLCLWPIPFVWALYYRILLPARAPSARGVARPFMALAAAGLLAAGGLAWSAWRPAPFLRVFHALQAIPGGAGDAHGVSFLAEVASAGGALDLALADVEGGLGQVGPGGTLWRHPYRRFAREDAALVREASGPAIRGIARERGDFTAALAEWRAELPWLAQVRVTREGEVVRVRNDSPHRLLGLQYWDGRSLHRAPDPLAHGQEAALGTPPPNSGRPPVQPDTAEASAFVAWLRREVAFGFAAGAASLPGTAQAITFCQHLDERPRRIVRSRRALWFLAQADPGPLRIEGGETPEHWLIVEIPLP